MSLGIDFDRYQFDQRLKDIQDKVLSLNFRAPQDQVPKQIPEPQYLDNQYYPRPQYNPYSGQLYSQQYIFQPNQQYAQEEDSSSDEEQPLQPIRQKTQATSLRSVPVRPSVQQDIIKQQRKQQKQWLEQIMQNDKAQEQQLLGYIEQQNQVIKQLSDKLLSEKKRQEKEEKQKLQEIQRQKELQQLEEMLTKRQEHMLSNVKRDILDSIDPQNYGYNHNQYFYSPQNPNYQQLQPQQYIPQVPIYQPPPPIAYNPIMQNIGLASPPLGISQYGGSSLSRVGRQSMRKVDNILNGI